MPWQEGGVQRRLDAERVGLREDLLDDLARFDLGGDQGLDEAAAYLIPSADGPGTRASLAPLNEGGRQPQGALARVRRGDHAAGGERDRMPAAMA